MDLQIGIFCLVIASLSALLISIILSISSIKEGSFEEAKANRRKMIKQYQDQSKTGVDKVKEKKVKKTSKKSKKIEVEEEPPSAKETEPEPTDEKESKKPPPKSAEVQVKETEHKKPTKSEKTKKQIQPPSDAGVPSTSPDAPLVQHKPAKEKQQNSKNGKKRPDEVVKSREDEVDGSSFSAQPVEEPVVLATDNATAKQAPKPSRKKRAEITTLTQLSNEKGAVNMNLLVSLVQKAELSRTEIQLLIDALLNKQQEDVSEWLKGRQDPQVKLQKQLAEMEQALKDEKQISIGFQAKLKELRNEINADKANARHSEELLFTVQNDCKALSLKLQAAIEENQVLSTKIQQYQKQLADEQSTARKLKEDLSLQQQIAEKQCHEAVINLQAQVNQYAAQSQELQAANNGLRGEIALLQENDLRIQEEYREVNANLERALSAATFDANTFRNELTNAQQALSESREEIENLGGIVNKLNVDVLMLQTEKAKALDQCLSLTKENDTLKEKMAQSLENGYSNSNKQDIANYEARLEESNKSLTSLKTEIDVKNKKIEELNSAVTTMKNECQKTRLSLEKATKEISTLKTAESQKCSQDDTITQLKNVLNDKNKELTILKIDLESCKIRNNELRNKNWKVVEALAKAEQSLQGKINEQKTNDTPNVAYNIELKKSIQRIVSHLHPQLAIVDKEGLSIEEWLRKAEEAVTDIESSSSTSSDLQSRNSQLQSLVQHYKTIITETEGMLNQLQSHVEVEESQWKEKLRTLEGEIELLKQQSNSKCKCDT